MQKKQVILDMENLEKIIMEMFKAKKTEVLSNH